MLLNDKSKKYIVIIRQSLIRYMDNPVGKLCLKEACKMEVKCWNCHQAIKIDAFNEWGTRRTKDDYGFWLYEEMPKKAWKRFYCTDCEPKVKEQFEADKEEYIQLKMKMMLERAIVSLERQRIDIYKYREAIEVVENFALKNPSKFESSHELIAAIILINDRVHIKAQYQIDRYRVDFCLPEYKCLLEIDGERHEERLLEDSNRDIKIRRIMGPEWEVVRIPTKYLDENAKVLLKAVISLKEKKQEIRRRNEGIIPSHFSKRDKAKSEEVEKIVKMQHD